VSSLVQTVVKLTARDRPAGEHAADQRDSAFARNQLTWPHVVQMSSVADSFAQSSPRRVMPGVLSSALRSSKCPPPQ
jgi:hypothetical protein